MYTRFACLKKTKGFIKCLAALLLLTGPVAGVAQSGNAVKGIVENDMGVPLVGANVVAKNSKTGFLAGLQTDSSGMFRFAKLPAGGTYSFTVSMLNYETQILSGYSIKNDETVSLFIKLKSQVTALNDVVVVGYGTQKRSDLTGAVTSVSEKQMQSQPVANFQDALQGRSAGVQIQQTGGDLAGRFTISIRGVGSVTGSNEPLIVVDDVPLFNGNLSTINPKDIVAVDILKDASSTAIYGARASNGVVIVRTRRGVVGKPRLSFSTDIGVDEISKRYNVLSTAQQRQLFVAAFKNSNRNPAVYEDLTNPVWQINTDWQQLGTRSGPRQTYSLELSGGSESNRYAVSGSYINRTGTMRNSDLKSYFLRINNDATIGKRFKMATSLGGSYQFQNVLSNDAWGSGAYQRLISSHTYLRAYDDQGNFWAHRTSGDPYFGENSNPLIDQLLPVNQLRTTRLLGSVKGDLKLAEGLSVSGNFGADIVSGNGYQYLPLYKIGLYTRTQGSAIVTTAQDYNWVADLTMQYERRADRHNFKILAGYSGQQFVAKRSSVTGSGTTNNTLNQLANQTSFSATGSDVTASLLSSFLRLNYSYADKYLLTSTLRRDGSSKFGSDRRYGLFPSVSVAWRLSKEEFIKSLPFNDLKLRIGYGITGNQNIGDFAFVSRSGPASYVFGNSVTVGNAQLNIGNNLLQWESAKQFDLGLDATVLKGRLSFSIDYYHKKSADLLIQIPIPYTAGVAENPTVNLGSLLNEGIEFSLNSKNIVTRDFTWTTDFNITFNKNKVLDISTNALGQPLNIPGSVIPLANEPANRTIAGQPVGAFYMYKFAGIWQLGQEAAAAKWGSVPGDPRYADLSGKQSLTDDNKTFVGSPIPKYFGGFNNSFSYKNFSLNVLVNFAGGNKIYNAMRNLNGRAVPFNQQLAEVADFWTPTNPSNKVPRPSQGGNTTFLSTRVSDRYLEDGSYIRLKNISLGYNLPSSMLNRIGLQNGKILLSAANLVTLTKYTGLDPEASSTQSLLSGGIDYTPYPPVRYYSISVQLGF